MGMTLADIDKKIYARYLEEGLTHEQIMKKIPKQFRKRFAENVNKDFIQSHFGIHQKYFFPIIISFVVIFVGIILIFAV